MPFALGWDPDRYKVAHRALLRSAHATVNPEAPIVEAISLGKHVLREMMQGQAGTCWVHAAVCLAETLAGSLGLRRFAICRRLVAWEGKLLEGGGNPSDGGTVTDALVAMARGRGVGIAHEVLCPYTDDVEELGTEPPPEVFADALKADIALAVDVRGDDDARRLLSAGIPVAIGTWWPYGFDNGQTFMNSINHGIYGHALTKIGFVRAGVFPGDEGEHGWWQWQNWHGRLYPPLPPAFAERVPGYHAEHPDLVTHFWVRDDIDAVLQSMGNYEYVSATTIHGLVSGVVVPSFGEVIP